MVACLCLVAAASEDVAAIDPRDMQDDHIHFAVVNDAPRIALICVAAFDLVARSRIRKSKTFDLNVIVLRPVRPARL